MAPRATLKSPLAVRRRFFPHLCGTSRAAWEACIAAAFGENLSPEQHELFTTCTGRQRVPTAPVNELWLVCGRRAGKSETTAFLAIYLACFKRYALSPGEKAVGNNPLPRLRDQPRSDSLGEPIEHPC